MTCLTGDGREVKTRGVCNPCYQRLCTAVRARETSWAALIAAGKCLPAGKRGGYARHRAQFADVKTALESVVSGAMELIAIVVAGKTVIGARCNRCGARVYDSRGLQIGMAAHANAHLRRDEQYCAEPSMSQLRGSARGGMHKGKWSKWSKGRGIRPGVVQKRQRGIGVRSVGVNS